MNTRSSIANLLNRMLWALALTLVLQQSALGDGIVDDQFSGATIDPAKWTVVQTNYTGNTGTIGTDGAGHLRVVTACGSSSKPIAVDYVQAISLLPATNWEAYSAINFTNTMTGRSDVDLGYQFVMADGQYAYLQFDSRNGMTLKYGSSTGGSFDGAPLYPSQWYELRFAWSNSVLRAWYREQGGLQWLGGSANAGYTLFSSASTSPQQVKIGQADLATPTSSSAVTMSLLVDYWQQAEPVATPAGTTEDQFTTSPLNTALWRVQRYDMYNNPYYPNTGSAGLDDQGHLQIRIGCSRTDTPMAQEYVETIARLPNANWTACTAVNFTNTMTERSDAGLGFRFEMADGKSAYLRFDSRSGMTLKYGSNTGGSFDGPPLYPAQWYELKFAWSNSVLRAWYRERGGLQWLGGSGNAGYTLFSSAATWPERVKIGQTEIATPTSSSSETMNLLVDYWQAADPTPAAESVTADQFDFTPLDTALWRVQRYYMYNNPYYPNSGSVGLDDQGHLQIQIACSRTDTPIAQEYVETSARLPSVTWTSYTSVRFTNNLIGRSDVDLGYRFEMADGSYAYLLFDTRNSMTLKYGGSVRGEVTGPSLTAGSWYDLKFWWDGASLHGSYRVTGQPSWVGDYLLVTNSVVWPERVKIGQADIATPTSGSAADLTLLVDYWDMPPVPLPPHILTDPQSQTVRKGSNAVFTVLANGDATLIYLWRRNGTTVQAGASSALSITNVQTNHVGTYTVVVTNSVGSATSAPALLTLTGGRTARCLSPSVAGGQFQFSLTGDPMCLYVVQASTNLAGWLPIWTNVTDLSGMAQFVDSAAPNFSRRFYRVQSP